MATSPLHYRGFRYSADTIQMFFIVEEIFILLTDKDFLVYYYPDRPIDFHEWLLSHGIKELPKPIPG